MSVYDSSVDNIYEESDVVRPENLLGKYNPGDFDSR
jgi:hypothetical protein